MIQIINKVDVKLPDVQIEKIVTLIHKHEDVAPFTLSLNSNDIRYQYLENIYKTSTLYKDEVNDQLMTIGLSILKGINIDKKNILFSIFPSCQYTKNDREGVCNFDTLSVSMNLVHNNLLDILNTSSPLINEMISLINEKLKKFDTIIIKNLVENIMTISEKTLSPKMHLTARIAFLNSKEITKETEIEELVNTIEYNIKNAQNALNKLKNIF